jgi:hypothetical protein
MRALVSEFAFDRKPEVTRSSAPIVIEVSLEFPGKRGAVAVLTLTRIRVIRGSFRNHKPLTLKIEKPMRANLRLP